MLSDLGAPSVRLAVLGDVGTGDTAEWGTARLVAAAAASDPFDALILLGDNVYPNGDPARLEATVFEPFDPILRQGTALIPVLGNHDVRNGNAAGQVETLGMPGRWYATEIGPLLIVALDSNLVDDPGQLQWLESTLENTTAEWTLVAMHHPAYSAGYHGSTASVQDHWVPLFETYGVDIVLAGHDHDYQRSNPINGTTYIVSGAGSKTRPTDRADFTAYSASVLHWVDIGVTGDGIDITASSADGPFDHTTIDAATETSSASMGDAPFRSRVPAAIALGIGAWGATLWLLALLIGWYGPPRLVVDHDRAIQTGATVGMSATLIGFATATTLLVL
jgi:3',5'-cyclic AMP phosphodiesterase CpdA